MNADEFLDELRRSAGYDGQIVHVHEAPARAARYADFRTGGSDLARRVLAQLGIGRLYEHQAEALELARQGRNVLIATGTASGKSLCYAVPVLECLMQDADGCALLLFPTKALCQDQFRSFRAFMAAAQIEDRLAGVFDGDTPADLRRRLRDHGRVLFSNPDMIHAALLAQHGRWARFLSQLRWLVLDELHVYSGVFGSNMALTLRRLFRVCRHYGSAPRLVACSATIANPLELGEGLTGQRMALVDRDASPRGRRVYVFWNPPRFRQGDWHSRRSANVEAHELMARLIARGVPTITFSKSKMTAEMIHRYVTENLQRQAPAMASKVTPYRGGYLPEERRAIEARLFRGELVGVSTTAALELGIDVGNLGGCVIVGYPGTLASFFQQSGRAGRKEQDSIVFLVGLDTSVNQYVMSHPEYLFGRRIERAVLDAGNPFVATGHLRCATYELPLSGSEVGTFGPDADLALNVLRENRKVKKIGDAWYHAASEVPHHEVTLRNTSGANVVIEDADSGAVLGEVDRFDSQPIVHPEAIYMHQGDTYRVLDLDLDRNLARVKREEVDYWTQPLGGTDVHHIDARLREKPFGTGHACWGEVTAYFRTCGYEKIRFYSLDPVSVHPLDLPTMVLETMALWIVPPESVLEAVRAAGLDAHSGLRGVGYATRMLLPLFLTCGTLDFSHSVGSANSPWHTVFVYERTPHGLGFTRAAFERLGEILPAVLDTIRACACEDGCPCCVGKPLRGYATWNVELWEASIPSKAAAARVLEGFLGDGTNLNGPDVECLSDGREAGRARLEQSLRRRLERMREPQVFHAVRPAPELETQVPAAEAAPDLTKPDVTRRAERRRGFDRDLHRRLVKKIGLDGLPPDAPRANEPEWAHAPHGVRRPTDFPGRPAGVAGSAAREAAEAAGPTVGGVPPREDAGRESIELGDRLAARARRLQKAGKGPGP